jgi:hypothetical protein
MYLTTRTPVMLLACLAAILCCLLFERAAAAQAEQSGDPSAMANRQTISLAGTWRFSLDPKDAGNPPPPPLGAPRAGRAARQPEGQPKIKFPNSDQRLHHPGHDRKSFIPRRGAPGTGSGRNDATLNPFLSETE